MLRSIRFMMMLAVLALVTTPMPSLALPASVRAAPSVHLAPVSPAPLAPMALVGFALMGATAPAPKSKTKKVNLGKTYLFNGETFGPGNDVIVPDGFPDLDERGTPIHPEGTAAARNQATSRRMRMSSPPNTGGVNTGEGLPKTAEEPPTPEKVEPLKA